MVAAAKGCRVAAATAINADLVAVDADAAVRGLRTTAQPYVNPTAWPRVVVHGNEVVGVIMGNFDPGHELEAFRAGIWPLNVAADAQGRGVGQFAVVALADEARRRGIQRITVLWERGEGGPEAFYLRLGFAPTEELFGETVGTLDLKADPAPMACGHQSR